MCVCVCEPFICDGRGCRTADYNSRSTQSRTYHQQAVQPRFSPPLSKSASGVHSLQKCNAQDRFVTGTAMFAKTDTDMY